MIVIQGEGVLSGRLSYFSKRLIGTIILLLILVLLTPIGYATSHGPPVGHHPVPYSFTLFSFTWTLIFSSTSGVWSVIFFHYWYATKFVLQLPFRALFFFVGVRYSEGKSNRVKLIISGILGDLLVMFPMAIINLLQWQFSIVPLPLMTVIGVPLLLKIGEKKRAPDTESVSAYLASLFLFLLVFFIPYMITIGFNYLNWTYVGLASMIYEVGLATNGPYFSMATLTLLIFPSSYNLIHIPRFLVPVLAYFHFSGRVSLKRTLFVSIVLEILTIIPFFIAGVFAPSILFIVIPIPMLSLCIFIISKARSKRANSQSIISVQ